MDSEWEFRKIVGARLKRLRKAGGYKTGGSFANAAKIAASTLGNHEAGLRGIKPKMASVYESVLDLTPGTLLAVEENFQGVFFRTVELVEAAANYVHAYNIDNQMNWSVSETSTAVKVVFSMAKSLLEESRAADIDDAILAAGRLFERNSK